MKFKIMKMMVAVLTVASLCLMGCESEKAESGNEEIVPSSKKMKNTDGPLSMTVKDADGNVYPTTKIGRQIWMAKNLNVNVEGSLCFDNDPENCVRYGRLYTWEMAKKACPTGWRLPSEDEFEELKETVQHQARILDKTIKEGAHLSDSSWRGGLDTYGFSALPTGYLHEARPGLKDRTRFRYGESAYYWSASLNDGKKTVSVMDIFLGGSIIIEHLGSEYDWAGVRCIKDND